MPIPRPTATEPAGTHDRPSTEPRATRARRFGVVPFVRSRARSDRAILLAVFLVLLTTTTVAAATVWYADTAARSSLTSRLDAAGPEGTGLRVVASSPTAEADATAQALRDQVVQALPGVDPDVVQLRRTSGSFAVPGSVGETPDLTVFVAADALLDRASVVDGRWPVPSAVPLEVVVTEPAAAALAVSVGDELTVRSRIDALRTVSTVVVGTIRLTDPSAAVWARQPLLVDGREQGESFLTLGPLLIDPADLAATGEQRIEITTVALPDVAVITPAAIEPLRAGLAGLPARLEGILGRPRAATITTDLPELLASAAGSLLVGGTAILVLDLQLVIIASYAVVLVAWLMRDWRATESALLRLRGASRGRLLRVSTTEALALVGAAVVVGPLLAWLGLALVGAASVDAVGPTTLPSLLGVVGIVAAAGLVGLLLPGLLAGLPLASVRSAVARPSDGATAQRAGLDLALLVIAAIALWQLRAYGGPLTTSVRGSIGIDPLIVLAPAIGLLAGVLLALRLIPLVAGRLARMVDRRSDATGWMGTRQLARRPLRYTAPALLLVVATGIGGFSIAYAATWRDSQVDQVEHALGGATRLDLGDRPDRPTAAQATAIRTAVGKTAATPLVREAFDLGGQLGRGELVAVDGEAVADVVRLRSDLAARPAADLAAALTAARPVTDVMPLPDGTGAVAVDVRLDLLATRSDGSPIELVPDWRGAAAEVLVRDGHGRLLAMPGPPTALGDGRLRLVVDLRDADGTPPPGPLALLSVGVALKLPPSLAGSGSLAVDGVAAGTSATASDDWSALPFDASAWVPVRIDANADPRRVELDGADASRLVIPVRDQLDDPFGSTLALRVAALDPAVPVTIPALASRSLVEALGASVGDVIQVGDRFEDPWSVRIVDVVELVPGTRPDRPAILADLPSLELAGLAQHGTLATATEWWLGPLDDASALVAAFPDATLERAADETTSRLDDPVVRSLIGALVATTVAAALFAAIGLTVSFAAGARERRHEFAVLAALGLTRRQTDRALALEAGFIIASGIVAGLMVAAILAWVVLPSVALKVDPGPVVPPARIAWPVWVLVPALLAAVGLWALLVAVARAQLARERVAQTIREADR